VGSLPAKTGSNRCAPVLILLITIWLGLWGHAAHRLAWTDAGEFIKVLGSIATGGAAVTRAQVADPKP